MASFQPRFPEIRYAIGRLVVDRANAVGLDRRELVNRLGYQGRECKGHQLLTAFMAGENLSPPFVALLPDILEVGSSILDAALLATARELDAEAATRVLSAEEAYRTSFRPHLQVRTEREVPSPIFAAALIGTRRLRIIELPDALPTLDGDVHDDAVRSVIVRHYHENRSYVPCFGAIIGYFAVRFPGYDGLDFALPYDCHGWPTGPMTTVPRLPDALLGKRRADGRLNGLLKHMPVQVIP